MAAKGGEGSFAEDGNPAICQLCLKRPGVYTCPRCNFRYCSTECYKCDAHAECSEEFYKKCVMEGLKDTQSSPEDKQKVMEMLERLEKENPVLDSDDDEDEEDLEERLQGLDLDKDTDQIWQRLTDKERREFQAMVDDGRLGNMVELWEPWWKVKQQKLVEEINPDEVGPKHPKIFTEVEDISKLLPKSKPSETLPYTVMNVLYGYAYISRLHNGECSEVPRQCSQEVTEISGSLTGRTYQSTAEALHGCMQCLQEKSKNLHVSQEFSIGIVEDVRKILEGPNQRIPLVYTMAALSDLRKMFISTRKATEREIKSGKASQQKIETLKKQRQHWFGLTKKVEFLLSWTHEYGLMLQTLIPQLQLEFCSLSTELATHNKDQEMLESVWGGKRPPKKMHRFIEEISDR